MMKINRPIICYFNNIFIVIILIFCVSCSFSSHQDRSGNSLLVDIIKKDELDRLRKCSDVVKYEYRPQPGGGLQEQHRSKYLSVCFRKPNELPLLTNKQLKSVVASLTKTKSSGCTATLISSNLAITARHCFTGNEDVSIEKVSNELLNESELSGTDWKVKGLKIVLDPFDPENPLYAKARVSDVVAKQALDFVAISPKESNVKFGFGVVEPIHLVSNATLKTRDRLIISSFFPYSTEFFTDNFPSCLVTQTYEFYFRHHCQSIGTSSGSPIFSYGENEKGLIMVGIHVGREGYLGPINSETENEALLLPDYFVNEVNNKLAILNI